MENERRSHTRVPVAFEVIVTIQDEEIPITTQNISLRGMLCPPNDRFQVGKTCQVVISLTADIKINIEGKILRTEHDGTGIFFSSMSDKSFVHLKRLVQYNTADPDKIDAELTFISG